jgi:SPP1 gp7 family putative phage head morphogenesis protein
MADSPFTYTKKQLARLFKMIFSGAFTPARLPVDLYESTLGSLSDAVLRGFVQGDLTEEELGLLDYFSHNIAVFSGAKTHQQVSDMTRALIDPETGMKRSFSEFKRDANNIFEEYNVNWLKTEYRTAINNAFAARQWMVFQEEKDVLPFLRFNTVGDERVRDEHVELDGIVRHVDDPFWRKYLPPIDWNCRCDVTSHSEDDVTETPKADLKGIQEPDDLFAFNPAVDKIIFDENHPYISKVAERYHVLRDRNFDLPTPKDPRK